MSAGEADGEASVATGTRTTTSTITTTATGGAAVSAVAAGVAVATAVSTQTRGLKQGRVPPLWEVPAPVPLSGSLVSPTSSGALALRRAIFFRRRTKTLTPRERGREAAFSPLPVTLPAGGTSVPGRRRAAGKDGSSSKSSSRRTDSSTKRLRFKEPSSSTEGARVTSRIVSTRPEESRAGRSLTFSSGKEKSDRRTPEGTKARERRTSSKKGGSYITLVRTKTTTTEQAIADKASRGGISLISSALRPRTGTDTRVSSTATIASLSEEETLETKTIIGEREKVSPPLPLLSPPLPPLPPPPPPLPSPTLPPTPSWLTRKLPTRTHRGQDTRNWPTLAHPSPPTSVAKTSPTQEGQALTRAALSTHAGYTFSTRTSETFLSPQPRASPSVQSPSSPASGASGTALFASSEVYLPSYVHPLEAHLTDFEASSAKASASAGDNCGDQASSRFDARNIPQNKSFHPHDIAASAPPPPTPPPPLQNSPPSAPSPRVKAFASSDEKTKTLTKVNTVVEAGLKNIKPGRSHRRLLSNINNSNIHNNNNSSSSNNNNNNNNHDLALKTTIRLSASSSPSLPSPPPPPLLLSLLFSTTTTLPPRSPAQAQLPISGRRARVTITTNKLGLDKGVPCVEKRRKLCIENHIQGRECIHLSNTLSSTSPSSPPPPPTSSPSSSLSRVQPLPDTLSNKISIGSFNSHSWDPSSPVINSPHDSPAGSCSSSGPPPVSPKTHRRRELVVVVEPRFCSTDGGDGRGSGEGARLGSETDCLGLSTHLVSTSTSPSPPSLQQPLRPLPPPPHSQPPFPSADGGDEGEEEGEKEAVVEGDVSPRYCRTSCHVQGTSSGRASAVTCSSSSLEESLGSYSGSSSGPFPSPSRHSSVSCASCSSSSFSCLSLPSSLVQVRTDPPDTLRFNTWRPQYDTVGNVRGHGERSREVTGHWSNSYSTIPSSFSSSTKCSFTSSSCSLAFPYWVTLLSCLAYVASKWLKSSLLKTLYSLMHYSSYVDVPPPESSYSKLPSSKSPGPKPFLKTFSSKSSSPKSSCSNSPSRSRSSRPETTSCPSDSHPAAFSSKHSYSHSSCSKSPGWIPNLAFLFLATAVLVSGGAEAFQTSAPLDQRTQDLSQEEVIGYWNSAASAQADDEGTMGVWGWVRETTKTDLKNPLDHQHLLHHQHHYHHHYHHHHHHHQEQDPDDDDKTVYDNLMTFGSGSSPHEESLNHFFKHDTPRSLPSHPVSFVTSHASYANLSYSTPTVSRSIRRARSVCGLGEVECGDGSCMASDQYCDGEADCSDAADEPSHCSPCGRIYYGSVGKTYEILLHWPREARRPPQCNLTLVAAGDSHGDLVQLAFHKFTLGKFHSHKDRGCPHGHMQVVENQRKYRPGYWCGDGSDLALYYSETPSVSVILTILPTDNDLTALDAIPSFYLRMTFKFLRREDAVVRYGLPRKPKYLGLRNPSTLCNTNINNCDSHTCYLQSPNFPGMYPRNTTCYYHLRQTRQKPGHRAVIAIRQDSPHLIHIKSQSLPHDLVMRHLKLYEECYYVGDYVRIYDGGSTQSPVLITFCRGDILPEIISSGPNMLIEFTTSPYDYPLHKSPWSHVSGFELQARTKFIPLEKLYPNCHLVLDSKENMTGFVKNVEHSVAPNTTCVYEFRGHGRQVVWLYFIKYVQIHNMNRLQTILCSTKLDIVDGRWSPKPDMEMRILGQHCKNSEPRMCDRGFRELQNKDVRPCTVEESYVSSGNNMTVVQLYGEGSVITDIRFLLKYEFVDVSLPGEEVEPPCARVIKSDGYSHNIHNLTTPRNVFLYGRGGSPKLHCSFTLQAMNHEVVRLTISHLKTSPESRCMTGIHHETEAKECITTAGPHIALRITEYPWPGVAYPRACICSSDAVPFTLESSSSVLQLNITITGMKPHEDYRHFWFIASYEFTKKPPCLRTQHLTSSSGEITFESPSLTDHDRNCEGHPWLLTTPPGHQIYINIERATFANGTCASGTRLFFYRPNRGKLYRTVCPAANVEHNVHFFSQPRGNLTLEEMEEEEEAAMGAMTSRQSSLLLVYQPRSASQLSVKWLQVRPITKLPLLPLGASREDVKVGAKTEEDAGGWRQNEMVEEEGECKEFCPELDACIHPELWCDGHTHCPLGTDEMVSNCLLERVPWLYLSIVSVTLLTLLLITASAVRRRRRQRSKKRQQAARRVSTQESILPKDNRLSAYSIEYTDMDFETTRGGW